MSPIKRENRHLYPDNWLEIRELILERARHDGNGKRGEVARCECRGECGDEHAGRCDAPDRGEIYRHIRAPWLWYTRHEAETLLVDVGGDTTAPKPLLAIVRRPTLVVLTVAHLDQDPTNNDDGNLLAMCQRCHLVHDARWRKRHAEAQP